MMLSVANVNLIKTKDRNKQKKGKNCFKTVQLGDYKSEQVLKISNRCKKIRNRDKDFKSRQRDFKLGQRLQTGG